MKRNKKTVAALVALACTAAALATPIAAMADSAAPYVSLGADLSSSQKATVLSLLGLTESDLEKDTVVTVTNAEEHQYLDGKISAEQIGTKALSSCKVTEAKSGSGITVETHNISYVTPSMYENALATAGMEDADVVVVGPTNISGTAALVGAMKAYAAMNGDVIEPTTIDTATDELVTTGQVAEDTGSSDKATELIAAVKQIVIANNYTENGDINNAIDDVSGQMGISLSDEDRQLISELMQKISKLNLDADTITKQASNIYDQLKNSGVDFSKYGISTEQATSFLQKLINWLKSLFS
jgi:uncharacterized protein YpuA (DUF1002 family)